MTAALTLGAGFVLPRHPDRGISDDARLLRDRFAEALEFSETITIGDAKRHLLLALDREIAAYMEDADECDAAPVEPGTYEYARDFILMLPTTAPIPEIAIDSDGEVSFEWDRGSRQIFSVSIGRDGALSYAGLFGISKSHGTEQLGDAIPAAVAANIQRVDSGT